MIVWERNGKKWHHWEGLSQGKDWRVMEMWRRGKKDMYWEGSEICSNQGGEEDRRPSRKMQSETKWKTKHLTKLFRQPQVIGQVIVSIQMICHTMMVRSHDHNFMRSHYHDFMSRPFHDFIWSRFHVVFALHISPSRCSFRCLVCISTMLYRIISMNVGTGLCHTVVQIWKVSYLSRLWKVTYFSNIYRIVLTTHHHGYNTFPWLQLRAHLTRDFTKEGWLSKTGPRAGDAFRRRWVSLDKRKLMYYEDPLVSTSLLVICHYPCKAPWNCRKTTSPKNYKSIMMVNVTMSFIVTNCCLIC